MLPFVDPGGRPIRAWQDCRRRALPQRLAAVGRRGCGWYFLNLAKTGAWDGHLAAAGFMPASKPQESPPRLRSLNSQYEPTVVGLRGGPRRRGMVGGPLCPGCCRGGNRFFGWRSSRSPELPLEDRRRRRHWLTPLAMLGLAPLSQTGYQWLFFHVGRPDLGVLDQDRGFVGASALASFFGPLGLLLLIVAAIAILRSLDEAVRVYSPSCSSVLRSSAAAILAVGVGYDALSGAVLHVSDGPGGGERRGVRP